MGELWPGGPLTLPHTIVHDRVRLTIPEIPVTDQFYWLSGAQWWRLYPNAVPPEETDPLRLRLLDHDDPFDLIHLHDVATRLFGRLAGMASENDTGWWPSVQLAYAAINQWPLFHAWCIGRGISPLSGTLMTAVSAAYAWMRDGLGHEQLVKFEQELWETPMRATAPGTNPEDVPEHIRQEEAGAFMAALGEQLPGEVKRAH